MTRDKGPSTRDLIEAHPLKFQEYLALENALCSPHGAYMDPRERERAEHQLDQLHRFFRFDQSRAKL